jgi:hypothetical protein
MLQKLCAVFILFFIITTHCQLVFAQTFPGEHIQRLETFPTNTPTVTSTITAPSTPPPSPSISPSAAPSISPSISVSPSPPASISAAPSPSIPVSPSTTPTVVPVTRMPTPSYAPETKVATIAAAIKEAPIVKSISRIISFPANFFTRALPQELYTPAGLSKDTTVVLLLLSLVFLIVGMLVLKPGILQFLLMRIRGAGKTNIFKKREDDFAGV